MSDAGDQRATTSTCRECEARSDRPDDNLHCVRDGSAHCWHTCGDIKSYAFDSDCPAVAMEPPC